MRAILSLSLLGLVLVLLLNAEADDRGGAPGVPGAGGAAAEGATVRIFSCGSGLPPAYFERRERHQEIIVDGELLSHDTNENGLRFATFPLGGGTVEHGNFDLTKDPDAAAALAAWVDGLPAESVLALAVFRAIDPRGPGADERVRILGELWSRLGVESEPHGPSRASWAWLGVRLADGWQRLGERFSEAQGVMLARSLPAEVDAFVGRAEARRVVQRSRSRRLLSAFPYGTTRLDSFNHVRRGYGVAYEVNHVQRDGVSASPPFGPELGAGSPEEKVIAFPFVLLGASPRLEVELAIESYHRSGGCRGVEFRVLVDGQEAGRRAIAIDPNEPDAWLPWTIDLSRWERRWVRLELVTRRLNLPLADLHRWPEPAIWGNPLVVDLPSAELAAEPERGAILALLDHRPDGILTRDEIPSRLLATLDRDRSGRITLEEETPPVAGMVAKLDRNGDGGVDRGELEALYDHFDEWLFPGRAPQ